MRAPRWTIVVLGLVCLTARPAGAALDDLARKGNWRKILEVASRRGEQLPLTPGEAMVAAHAARVIGDSQAEAKYLAMVVSGGNAALAALADVQLARALEADDPAAAADLAIRRFDRTNPWPVRDSAATTASSVIVGGLDPDRLAVVEAAAARLSRSLRRRLELALAMADESGRRRRLAALLAASTTDLVALEAAELLSEFENQTELERWRVASTFYRHALYDRAAPILEDLEGVRAASIPADRVLFVRGRCAFRRDRWDEAIAWYQKALKAARRNGRRAEIEVHIGRSYELKGDLDEAADAAVRAVRLDTTDDRRLFLARLRLRRGESDLAARGISHLRSRSARARGAVMLALDSLRRGDTKFAAAKLEGVRRRPWSAPAAVLAAEVAAAAGAWEAAISNLERGAPEFDAFWGQRARLVMTSAPSPLLDRWRAGARADIEAAEERSRWRKLGLWATLEPDERWMEEIRRRVLDDAGLTVRFSSEWFRPGLAAELWSVGLESEAGRWDPSGFPNSEAGRSAWSAARFAEFGMPWNAVRVADGAWRQAGADVPLRAFPPELRRSTYPLPEEKAVRAAAKRAGIDWCLLASLAREESRWNPRALSAVGARGLVQLMPATARSVAERLGAEQPDGESLFIPETSLLLGAAELARLLEVFDGRRAPAVAAYNAGELQAKLWLEQCGDNCTDSLFVANVSFTTTRAYTATVLAGAEIYRELHAEAGTEESVTR